MRKSNSIFKTAFVSESGAQLVNNDYFAYIEDDDYACYVLASGITDQESSDAAKEAVENLILSFEERPSMAKTTLLNYMKETNERLLSSRNAFRLKASVIMLVTDYEKFRYVSAGSVRLRMYRQGRFFLKSSDMSLANDMIQRGESDTPLDKHEEKNNLYAYLGKKGMFRPYVSKVEKLKDADIIALYSQGLWDNVDEQELDEVFAEASDKPQESVDYLEDILLSRQPPDLKSYTIATIFINKAYKDPERERKRMLYIKIACIVLIIILIVAIIAYIIHRYYEGKAEDFNSTMEKMQEYIAAENFMRAQETCKQALDLAGTLRRKDDVKDLNNELILLDSIVQADNFFGAKNFPSAYETYLNALKNSDGANPVLKEHIQRRLAIIESQLNIDQFMELGDYLFQEENYDAAEGMYNKALNEANVVHDKDGRNHAIAGIEKIYDKRAQLRKDADQELAAKKQTALSDAMNKGDDLLAAGDLEGARQAYLDARNLSDNPADRAQTSQALGKVADAKEKKDLEEKTSAEELQKQFEEASQIEAKGDASFDAGDYLSAQVFYLTAIEKFYYLHEMNKVQFVQRKYDMAGDKYSSSLNKNKDAENLETQARNLYIAKNYEEAKAAANAAKNAYAELGLKDKAAEMDVLLQEIITDEQIADALK